MQPSARDAATGADVVVVMTERPELRDLDVQACAKAMRGSAIVDCRNLLDPATLKNAGLAYDGVGRS